MKSITREKIALVVFAILVILTLSALVWYLSVGKTWNIAASGIDDATGQLDGYVVVLYEGTVKPAPAEEKTTPQALADRNRQQNSPENQEGNPTGPSQNGTQDTGGKTGTEEDRQNANGSPSDDQEKNSQSPLGSGAVGLTQKKEVTMSEVAQSYKEKDAEVIILSEEAEGLYADGVILKRNNQRFGIVSVARMDSSVSIQAKIDYFVDHKVDTIIVLVSDKSLVASVSGIDILITTENSDLFTMGETIDGKFCVNTPQIGSIGAILVSPHNVVSVKTITESPR